MGIRTQKPLPKGPAFGGALGEGLRGPYAHRRGGPDRQNGLAPPYAAPPMWRPPNLGRPRIPGFLSLLLVFLRFRVPVSGFVFAWVVGG